jgi:hypothetical protein
LPSWHKLKVGSGGKIVTLTKVGHNTRIADGKARIETQSWKQEKRAKEKTY